MLQKYGFEKQQKNKGRGKNAMSLVSRDTQLVVKSQGDASVRARFHTAGNSFAFLMCMQACMLTPEPPSRLCACASLFASVCGWVYVLSVLAKKSEQIEEIERHRRQRG